MRSERYLHKGSDRGLSPVVGVLLLLAISAVLTAIVLFLLVQ